MGITIRSLVAAAIVAGIYVGGRLLDGWGIPTTGTYPQQALDDLPRQLGEWQGEDQEMDPQLFEVTGATFAVNRLYTNPAGETMMLHATVKVFTNDVNLPHPPPRCYTGSGHSISEMKILDIDLPDGTTIPAQLMTAELGRRRTYVLYWYKVGDDIVHDGPEMRRVTWKMRGKEAWPPVLKVMLSHSARDEHEAVSQLKSIAEPLPNGLTSSGDMVCFTSRAGREPDER